MEPQTRNYNSRNTLQLWSLFVSSATLIVLLLGLPVQYMQIVDDLTSLITKEKPLEGVWTYRSTYTEYYNNTIYEEPDVNELYGKGNAIIFWKKNKNRYEVYINYGVYRYGNSKGILAAFLNGYIANIDDKGLPENSTFEIKDLKIINRVHYKNADPSTEIYEFINCGIKKKNSDVESYYL